MKFPLHHNHKQQQLWNPGVVVAFLEGINWMDAETESTQLTTTKPLGQLGRDEMNLAEFPITLLTDRVPKDQTEAIYQDEIYDLIESYNSPKLPQIWEDKTMKCMRH